MKWLTILAVLLVAMPAAAELMAVGIWNDEPETWTGYGDHNDAAGFQWLRINADVDPENPGQHGVTCIGFGLSDWPDTTGGGTGGRWGGGLYDEPGVDAAHYMQVNQSAGGPDTLLNEAGTIEFWFKPDWDPANDFDAHAFIMASTGRDWDGLRMAVNGDGTARSQFFNQNDVDVGHDWDPSSLVQDWNHMAYVWDFDGNYTYLNGNKVGETIYAGAEKVGWGDWHLVMLGQEGNWTGGYQSDGTWDSMGIWSNVQYSGATYDVPTEELVIPVVDTLLGDRDGDGWVGQTDLDIVLGSWGSSPPTDPRADVNDDNFVGQTDLDAVLGDWGQGIPPAAVPEPATLALLGMGALAVIRRRRK